MKSVEEFEVTDICSQPSTSASSTSDVPKQVSIGSTDMVAAGTLNTDCDGNVFLIEDSVESKLSSASVSETDSARGILINDESAGAHQQLVENDPHNLPSVGSANHFAFDGSCRACCFFMKGRCVNGTECSFCHYEHDKTKRKSNKGARQMKKGDVQNMAYPFIEQNAGIILLSPAVADIDDSRAASSYFSAMQWQEAPTSNVSVDNCSAILGQAYEHQRSESKHVSSAINRPVCHSPTCTSGILPRCPLCGRWRVVSH